MAVTRHFKKIPRWLTSLIPILMLYFCYVILSKLGTILIIPPGPASVMWPSAGIALGFAYVLGIRCAPAIFLASITVTYGLYEGPAVNGIAVTIFLALGATLHAVLGAALIKCCLRSEFYLGSLKDILLFLLLGGPLACFITANIAGLTFVIFADLPSDQFIELAKIWWIGDILGVIVFAPFTVIVLSHIYNTRMGALTASTLPTIIVPLIISISIFIFSFHSVKNELIEDELEKYVYEVNDLIHHFKEDLTADIIIINATASYIQASKNTRALEFKIFANALLDRSSGLYGMSWLPKVSDNKRDAFVQDIREQGYLDFEIKSRNNKGRLQSSKTKPVYYPLTFMEPYNQNALFRGLDIYWQDDAASAERRALLDAATDLGVARATSRFSDARKQDEYGFIIYHPVFKEQGPAQDLRHIGYVNGIFKFPDLLQSLAQESAAIGSEFFLTELSDSLPPLLLFDTRTTDNKEGSAESYDLDERVHFKKQIDVVGKNWELTFIKKQALLAGENVTPLWLLAGGGALFNTLLLIILMMTASQNNFVQKLVAQRTRELKQANEELEEFAYRTSHDLRSPIVSSVTLLRIAGDAIKDGQTKIADDSINHARKSLSKLERLISDILTLTHIGSSNEAKVLLNVSETINAAISKLDHANGFENLTIERDIRYFGRILTKPSRLKLILENLISNAAKYQDPEKDSPNLKISVFSVNEHLYLEFSDNGLGISEEYRHQAFEMFRRFHPKVADGTGLGLYLMKKSAHVLEGEISYHPLENGSLFRLIIPIR